MSVCLRLEVAECKQRILVSYVKQAAVDQRHTCLVSIGMISHTCIYGAVNLFWPYLVRDVHCDQSQDYQENTII